MDKINMYLSSYDIDLDDTCPISLEEIKDDSRALFQCVWYGKTPLTQSDKKILLIKKWTIVGDVSEKFKCHGKKYDLEMLYKYVVENKNTTDPFTRERFSPYLERILRFKYSNKEHFLEKAAYKFKKDDLYAHLKNETVNVQTRINTQLSHLPFLINATREIVNEKLKPREWLIRGSRIMGSLFILNDFKDLIPKDGFYVLSFMNTYGSMRHYPFKHIYGYGYVLCKYKKYVPVPMNARHSWFPCVTDLIMYYIREHKLDVSNAVDADVFIKRL